jgi:hypothetical protein
MDGTSRFPVDSNMLVSITVDGDRYCTALEVNYRLATRSARSFRSQFVTLSQAGSARHQTLPAANLPRRSHDAFHISYQLPPDRPGGGP